MSQKKSDNHWIRDFLAFLASRSFWIQIGVMILLTFLIIWGVFFWLDSYTRHGQQLLLPDYVDKPIELAKEDAADRSFEIVISDSVFIVGEEGGIITRQNPKPKSKVKEGRKIYVTITKYLPEFVQVSALPRLYGESYEIKKEELENGYDLHTRVIDEIYDPGPEGHIMEVYHGGERVIHADGRIPQHKMQRGDTLDVILSRTTGGYLPLPKLVCKTLEEARFQLGALQIHLGKVEVMGATDEVEKAYIVEQTPTYEDGSQIQMGDSIQVVVSPLKPDECSD